MDRLLGESLWRVAWESLALLFPRVGVRRLGQVNSFVKLVLHHAHVVLELIPCLHEHGVLHEAVLGIGKVIIYSKS